MNVIIYVIEKSIRALRLVRSPVNSVMRRIANPNVMKANVHLVHFPTGGG